ncbi:hypothetical protein BX600DRAFT_500787 [Xylariales sp. PMI_506]|nr:hypothetical protein BX600DRAFT_500787 [Xylariales sp. PMI_506]
MLLRLEEALDIKFDIDTIGKVQADKLVLDDDKLAEVVANIKEKFENADTNYKYVTRGLLCSLLLHLDYLLFDEKNPGSDSDIYSENSADYGRQKILEEPSSSGLVDELRHVLEQISEDANDITEERIGVEEINLRMIGEYEV